MNNTQKLLVGLGIGVVLYYLYTRNKGQAQATPQEAPKNGGINPAYLQNSQGQNAPQTLNSLAVNAPSTLPTNLVSSNKPMETQAERDCRFQYIRMPKPQVVRSNEDWKRDQDDFVKKCMENKQRKLAMK